MRDWGFAGDFVRAMWMILQSEIPRDYIVATGKCYSIRDLLTIAFKRVGIEEWTPYIKSDPRFKRPAELFSLKGCADNIKNDLGWTPEIDFDQLITMMVDEDLKRIQAQK